MLHMQINIQHNSGRVLGLTFETGLDCTGLALVFFFWSVPESESEPNSDPDSDPDSDEELSESDSLSDLDSPFTGFPFFCFLLELNTHRDTETTELFVWVHQTNE